MMLLLILVLIPDPNSFTHISGFAELDALAKPTDFAFLLIQSDDTEATDALAEEMLDVLELLDIRECILYTVSPNAEGYYEISLLTGGVFPSVVVLVGHCGFIEMDTALLEAEMEDAWLRWGDGNTSGICNYCRRCNPNALP